MMLSDPRSFRRQMAGVAMVVAPVVLVVAELLHARFETDPAAQLAAVAENRDRWYAAHVLVLVAIALAVPIFLGLTHMLRRSRPALAHVARLLFVPGLVALTALAGMEFVLWQMARPGADRAEMVALAERVNESAGILPLFLVVFLFPVAWLLAGIGLYLSRAVYPWAATLIGLAQPIGFVSEFSGGPKIVAVAAQIAFAIGLIPVGLRVLRTTDEEWDALPAAAELTPAVAR